LHGHDPFHISIASPFRFLLKEELQQDWRHEEDEFIEGVA
jgi:hypothetical protein